MGLTPLSQLAVSQVETNLSVGDFTEEPKPTATAFESQNPIKGQVAVTEVVESSSSVGESNIEEVTKSTAVPSNIESIPRTTQVTVVNENETTFDTAPTETKVPQFTVDFQESANVESVTAHESESSLEVETPEAKSATRNVTLIRVPENITSLAADSEVAFSPEQTPTKSGTQGYEPGHGLNVQTVEVNESEGDFVKVDQLGTEAKVNFTALDSVQVSTQVLDEKEAEFEHFSAEESKASVNYKLNKSLVESRDSAMESVDDFESTKKEGKSAKRGYVNSEPIVESQVTTSEGTLEYKRTEPVSAQATASITEQLPINEREVPIGETIAELDQTEPYSANANPSVEFRPVANQFLQDEVCHLEDFKPTPGPLFGIASSKYQVETVDEEEEVEAGDHIGIKAKKTEYYEKDGVMRERKVTVTRFRKDERTDDEGVTFEEIEEESEGKTRIHTSHILHHTRSRARSLTGNIAPEV